MFVVAILAILIGGYFLYEKYKVNRNLQQFQDRNVKFAPVCNLMWALLRKQRTELKKHEVLQREGPVFGFEMIFKPTIMIADPELIQQVMIKHFTNFTNRRKFQAPDPLFAKFLTILEDEDWKRCRSVMTPTFALGKLRLMKNVVDDTAKILVKNMGEKSANAPGNDIEIKHIVGAYTMDSIIRIAFGIKIDSLIDAENPIILHAKKLFQTDMSIRNVFFIFMNFVSPRISKLFNLRVNGDVIDYFHGVADEVISKQSKEPNKKPSNFIELLMEADRERLELEKNTQVQNGKQVKFMTNDEIVAQCILFFLVGYDTTATTISLALYELALRPDFQERLYEELQQTKEKIQAETGETDIYKIFSLEVVSKLQCLDATIKEVFRLYSPLTFVERSAAEDVELESEKHRVHVKKGDVIHVPIYSVHRDPENWPEPEAFRPERFLQETPTHHPYSYLPFGTGPRSCVAKSLAQLEAKFAIVHTVLNYKMARNKKTQVPVEFYYQANLLINKDIHINVVPRNK